MLTEEQILESRAWTECVSTLRKVLHDRFEATDPKDADGLRAVAHELSALRLVVNELERRLRQRAKLSENVNA